jgi:hypothetical protein
MLWILEVFGSVITIDRFQMSGTGERQLAAGMEESIMPKGIDIYWIWKVFGPLITIES